MASFVQRLRMRNMFPINSDLGNANIEDHIGNDDMYEVINAAKDLSEYKRRMSPMSSGLHQVSSIGNAQPREGMRFGGVVGYDSNPGREMNERAGQDVRDIYESYKQPLPQAEQMGPSNDERYAHEYFERKNRETTAEGNAAYKKSQADSKGWKTVTITDPNDPSKQINARINEITGETQPITLPSNGVITRPGSAKDLQATIDAKETKKTMHEGIKTKAQEALDVLNQLSKADDKGNETLLPNTEDVTGFSGNFNRVNPFPSNRSALANKDRLKSLLTLDLLTEMKKQSKSGATGFGQMNLKELGVLEDAATKLDKMNVDEPSYARELGRIREKLNKILMDETPTSNNASSDKSNANAPKAPEGYEYVRRPDNKGWTAVKKIGGK